MSNCPSGQLGGNLGQFGPGEMVPEFDKAVFGSLAVGVLPTLVATRYGFHIVAVERRIAGRQVPFEAVEASVAALSRARVEERALRQYIEVLAGRAFDRRRGSRRCGVAPGAVKTAGGARRARGSFPSPVDRRMPSSPAGASASAPVGFALWNLGFRPFYLLAAIFAAAGVPLWIAQYAGLVGSPSYLAGPMWHVHEMVFGYTAAVIAGFLMTAVRNWTSRPTPVGAALAALAVLWIAARAASLTSHGYAAAVLSVAFPLIVAAALAVPIVRSANRHNYFFIAVLVLLALADLCFQLAFLGIVDANPLHATRVALDVILFVMTAISGRVVPMFTNNGIPGAGARRTPFVEGCGARERARALRRRSRAGATGRRGCHRRRGGDRARGASVAVAAVDDASARRWCGSSMSRAAGSPSICCCARSRRPAWSRSRWPRTR